MQTDARWQDWAILIIGAWLFVSPFSGIYVSASGAAAWNSYVVGAAVVFFAATSRWALSFGIDEEWANLALGLWLLAAPFVLGFYGEEPIAAWSQIVIGALIAGDAASAVIPRPGGRRRRRRRPQR